LKADQNSPKLDLFFEELLQEKDISKQNLIVNKIWGEWMQSDNTDVQIIMNNMPNYFQSQNYNDAISALSFVIEIEPSFSEAYNKRATFYFMIGEYEKSMRDIEVTLSLEPRHFGALDGMSRILIHYGKYLQALKVYDNMKLLMPNDITLDMKINRLNKLIYDSA
jgi:tetratricopeptide (TPR) repeat protein